MTEPTKQPRTKTTLYFPDHLWKQLKIEAIRRDCDATDLVALACEQWLSRELVKQKKAEGRTR